MAQHTNDCIIIIIIINIMYLNTSEYVSVIIVYLYQHTLFNAITLCVYYVVISS